MGLTVGGSFRLDECCFGFFHFKAKFDRKNVYKKLTADVP